MKRHALVLVSLVVSLCFTINAHADSKPVLDQRIHTAKLVLDEIMSTPDQNIPEELLAKCKAIAIYPSVIKGGFVFGARFGKGVVLAKDADGKWGPVAFSTIGGGSWGLQIGAQATDLILVIMNERGMNGILSNSFTMGAGGSIAVGPVGRSTEASTDLSLTAGILSYSRNRGVFGGVVLDGSVVTQDNNSNAEYYGSKVNSKDILLKNAVRIQSSSAELVKALDQYSQKWSRRIKSA